MNIKDSYIHNGTAVLKDIKVESSVLKKILAGKDANDAYLDWETVCDLTGIKPTAAGTADKVAHALTFNGGVTGNWDGSDAKTVAIPTKASWNYDDVYLKDLGLDTGNSTDKDKTVSLTNTNVYLKLFKTVNGVESEDSKVKIYGATNVSVTTDSSGDIKITGVDSVTNATNATNATYAANVGASGTAGTNYVTAANVISMYNWYNTITATDAAANTAIDKWNEIIDFLAGTADTSTLSGLLAGKANSTHYHSYTDLRGSGTTANQVIASSGTADSWTLTTMYAGNVAISSTSVETASPTFAGLTLKGDWEHDFGISMKEGGSEVHGFDVLYGANDRFKLIRKDGEGTTSTVFYVARSSDNIIASGSITSAGFKKSGATDSDVLLGNGGHTAISSLAVAWASITGKPEVWAITSNTETSYGLANNTWTNTINLPTDTGSYMLCLITGNSTLTGIFSIGSSDNAKDEISLHLHGNGTRLYARTNGTKLQLSSNYTPTQANPTQSTPVIIKYKRMI